jgi:ABC-type bacteriocin/lantibiotic exporter with double-glycine peptidase domain
MKKVLGEDYRKKDNESDDFSSPTGTCAQRNVVPLLLCICRSRSDRNSLRLLGTVMEALSNMRTVSALVLEDKRFQLYEEALHRDEPNYRMNAFSTGASAALALSLVQWTYALLFWFGGWLMIYEGYSFNSFLIASFGILFSFAGLGSAFSGLSDRAQVCWTGRARLTRSPTRARCSTRKSRIPSQFI